MPILKTIRRKFLEQKNLRNYLLYAIGEIILVVIGILLALQINSWNENVQKRKEETRILQNFHQDISSDIIQLETRIKNTHHRLIEIDSIFILMQNPSPQSNALFIKYNEGITRGDLFELNSGTYEQNLSSGKINYIQNDSLRESIFTYYRNINENLTQRNAYKFLIETILPNWGEIVIPTQEAMNFLKLKNTMPPLDIKSIAKNKKYNTVLGQAYGNHLTLIQLWKGYIKKANHLKKHLESELKS